MVSGTQSFTYYSEKGIENASDIDIRREQRVSLSLVLSRPYILFQLVISNRKVLPDPLTAYMLR